MTPPKKVIDTVKEFEGCRLKAYQDGGGVWTIGYGHTRGVRANDRITQSQANQLLIEDLESFCDYVDSATTVVVNDNEFAALVSLCYNIGCENFGKSTLLKLLNLGDTSAAANEFLKWDKVHNKPVTGLSNRRKAERKLFLEPVKNTQGD